MFELKKIFASILMPLPLLLVLGFIGLSLIMFTFKRRTGCTLTLISLLGILLLSFQPVSTQLLLPTEREYHGFLPVEGPIDYVMVLGSGHVLDDDLPITSELSRSGLMRLAEGIRILRMYPEAKLILSGYAQGSELSNARVMANIAISLGVQKSDVILLESTKDTGEEADQAANFIQDKPFVLVTSASHMQRALGEFKRNGLNPIPAPTNYLAQTNINQPWEKYTPKAKYLEQSERFWYEFLGRRWQELRALVSNE
ncbi:MAG: envelope biogenesis factor ElyC [Vibrio sp.]